MMYSKVKLHGDNNHEESRLSRTMIGHILLCEDNEIRPKKRK